MHEPAVFFAVFLHSENTQKLAPSTFTVASYGTEANYAVYTK